MARLNTRKSSRISAIEKTFKGTDTNDKAGSDGEKEKRRQLSSGNWKLSETQLRQHFGDSIFNSGRQLTQLIAFADLAPNFEEAFAYLRQAKAKRQAETVQRVGSSKQANWLVADIKKAMDDYKNQAENGQQPASDALKRKRGATVRKDTPVKKNRRSERHFVRHPIAPSMRQASCPPFGSMDSAFFPRSTRRATHIEASTLFSNTNRHSRTVSTLVESQNSGGPRDSLDSLVNGLLNSDDEGSDEYMNDVQSAITAYSPLDQNSQKVTRHADGKDIKGQLYNEGESEDGFKAGAGPQLAVTMHLDDPAQTHYHDKATQTYSHDRATDQAKLSDHSKTNIQERSGQTSEYDFSLHEYLNNQSSRISSRLQSLEATIHNCDQTLRILNNADKSGESPLDTHRKDTQAAKERLNQAQQMEQEIKGMHNTGGDDDDDEAGALKEPFQNYLKATSEWRESLQALYERNEAELRAMETQAGTRQEEILRVQREKQNARDELRVWTEWKDKGGKIFAH